jgi:sugar transferase (PEP-CTERM/EpsH1 system associated)
MKKPDVLYLTQRIPYPPDKGDKITSFNILKHLSERANVHLGTFVDDPDDMVHVEKLNQFCASTSVHLLSKKWATLRSAKGFLRNEALTLPYFFDAELQTWVDRTLQKFEINRALIFSSSMSQYVKNTSAEVKVLAHFADIDSDKWAQYAAAKSGFARWLYRREAQKLHQFEKHSTQRFGLTTFVTSVEVELYKTMCSDLSAKIGLLENGTDTAYWDPNAATESVKKPLGPAIVFTGAMDYFPNEDAVVWFAKEIFPLVRQEVPNACFYVVGSRPGPQVQALESIPNVTVTGRVADVRPYLQQAVVSVAPLRAARGIQNKVLEALAMGCAVVCTSSVAKPLKPLTKSMVVEHDESGPFARAVINSLNAIDSAEQRSSRRSAIQTEYSWQASLRCIDDYLLSV